MNVSTLIRHLEGCPPDAEVVLSKDDEGNSYYPVLDVTWETFVGEMPERGDLNEYWEEDWGNEKGVNRQPIIVIWPAR